MTVDVAQIPTERLAEWVAVAMSSTVVGVWVPLLILWLALWMFVVALNKAGKKIDLAGLILDENGKASMDRVIRASAFIGSFWVVQTIVYASPEKIEMVFGLWLGTWAGLDGVKAIWGKARPPSTQEPQQP